MSHYNIKSIGSAKVKLEVETELATLETEISKHPSPKLFKLVEKAKNAFERYL